MIDIVVSLVFDSWTEPLPELRSTRIEDRHLIYEGGGVVLDLLLRQSFEGAGIHIDGQVLQDDAIRQNVSGVPVLIEHGKQRSSTQTNALGEFAFHSAPNGTFDVSVILENRRLTVRGLSSREPRKWRVVPSVAAGGA